MKLFSLTFFILILTATLAHGYDRDEEFGEEQAQYSVEAIENALRVLRSGGSKSSSCDFQKPRQCNFASQCEALQGKGDSIYLYENAEGKKIPNFALYTVYGALEACMRSEQPQTLNEDPFLYPSKFSSAKNLKKWTAESGRMRSIFSDTQERLLTILESRKDGKNNLELDAMIAKVKTVKMNIPNIQKDWETLSIEGCEMPNAFYDPYVHTLTICPQIVNFPDATLMSVMAHEMAHSIDPCHCAQDLVKTNDGYQVDYAFDFQKGKFKKPLDQPAARGVGLKSNPLGSVISCLGGDHSIGVRVPTAAELQKKIDNDLKQMKDEGFTDKDDMVKSAKEIRSRIPQEYDRYGACSFLSDDGLLGEAFSDWASAQVLASKVKDIPDPVKARQFAFESQGLFMSLSCPGVMQSVQAKAERLLDSASNVVCGNAFMDFEALKSGSTTHPVDDQRMTKIIYAQPALQKALGCRPGKAQACQ